MSIGKAGVGGLEALESRRLLAGAPEFGFALGTSLADRATEVAQDAAGNAYVIGTFHGRMDMDQRPEAQFIIRGPGGPPFPDRGAFVAKYSPAGIPIWAVPIWIEGERTNLDPDVEGLRVDRL